jgi:glycosyltransferase involved in cell wall biosynthesis
MNGPDSQRTVLHLLTAFDFGGVEKHMDYLWSEAPRHRYRHVFAAIGGGGAIGDAMRTAGAEVTCLGANVAIPRPGTTLAVLRLLRRVRPDILHAHGSEPNYHGLLAGAAAGVPVRLAEEFGIPMYSDRAAFVFRQVYRTAHGVVCNCEAVRRVVVARGIAPEERTFVILNPMVVPPAPPARDANPAHFTVVTVGRLVPIKNIAILLPAIRRLRDEGVPARLWIVGDGPERAALEADARGLELGEAVRFWGYRGDVPAILAEADVYAHPSLGEGSALAVGEAMGAALPVICSDVGGLPEMVEDGRSGHLVPPAALDPLVAALRRLWEAGPARRRTMGAAARAAVIEKCDPGRYIAGLEAYYDGFFAAGGRKGAEITES